MVKKKPSEPMSKNADATSGKSANTFIKKYGSTITKIHEFTVPSGHSFPQPRCSNISVTTMEFPHTWEVLRAELLDTYQAPDTAELTAQLLAQLRPTGCILDGFQLVLGGTRILDAEVDLGVLIPAATFRKHKLRFQFWPRDIGI